MSKILQAVYLLVGLIALPTMAHADHQCFVDHVELAADGVNVYMPAKAYDGSPSLVVIPPQREQADPHYIFSYRRINRVEIDGKMVTVEPPQFTHMAIGEKAYVEVEIHSGCEMTVEIRNNQTVLHLVGGTSLPNMSSWHFDEVIVARQPAAVTP